ncbi:MAG: hypothetical protein ISR61_03955 [Desulfobacteraceae bacterium]|nr:hypothetical protein [Desulfobacteraceae bacterium]
MKGRWMVFFCILLSFGVARTAIGADSAPVGLVATLNPPSAKVGSAVLLTLNYHLPEDVRLSPDPQIKGLEGFTIVGRQTGPGQIRVTLLVDRIGQFKSGPLSLSYFDKEGKEGFLQTEPVKLIVLSNLGEKPEEAQLKPIYGIIPTTSGVIKYLPWVILALIACAAGIGLFLWIRRRRNRRAFVISQDPPHTLAKREIDELESQGLFEKGYVKEFYFRFSEIMRRYLESLRGFPAAEYTTQEIALSIHKPQDRQLLPLLQRADLVKFADLAPTPVKKDDEVKEALSYIRETGAESDGDLPVRSVSTKGLRSDRSLVEKSEETGR